MMVMKQFLHVFACRCFTIPLPMYIQMIQWTFRSLPYLQNHSPRHKKNHAVVLMTHENNNCECNTKKTNENKEHCCKNQEMRSCIGDVKGGCSIFPGVFLCSNSQYLKQNTHQGKVAKKQSCILPVDSCHGTTIMTPDTIVTSGHHGSIRTTFISNNSITQKTGNRKYI